MTIAELDDSNASVDFDRAFFPYLKPLETPSLKDLYARIEKARYTRWGLYAGAGLFTACAAYCIFKPIMACSFAVMAVACLVSSIFFQKPPPYLILGIDGGGIRGIIPAQLLALIEKEVGCKIGELFDCIAGTSIGGILTLALTQPNPNDSSKPQRGAAEALQFLEKEGPFVFERTKMQVIKSLEGVWSPKYTNDNLKAVLDREFNNTKISESVTNVLIPSYDLNKGRPMIFFNFKEEAQPNSVRMQDAGLGTAAAPTYFPSYALQHNGRTLNLVDGGLVANNPALLAFIKAIERLDPRRDVYILSIGTGQMPLKAITPAQSESYGMRQWLPLILDLMFQSAQDMITLQFKLLKHAGQQLSLVRLQPQLETADQENLDNATPDNIQALKHVAKRFFEDNYEMIKAEIVDPLRQYRASFSNPTTQKTQRVAAAAA